MAQSNKDDKKQIKELIKLNDELENYFSNTIIPQLFVDANLILRKFTPPAMKQFDFQLENIGKPVVELVDNIRYLNIVDDITEVIKSGKILEKEIQTTDMSWYEMNIIPYLVKKKKKTNGVIITFVDITGRIKNLRELEKLNASYETFIYSVSHDLKGPLSNIDGLVNLLSRASLELGVNKVTENKEQTMISDMLKQSVQTMKTIINELTEIAKIEGNYKEEVETVYFENILKEVDLTLKDIIIKNKATIHIDIETPKIKFSRKNLRSILYNLLSNAIKYRSPDRIPEVTITTQKEGKFITISVKDNGLGIKKEKQARIFDQYFRIEKDVEGMGIGLYLVKKIVENSGGKIVVNSKHGEGSEMIVYLPH